MANNSESFISQQTSSWRHSEAALCSPGGVSFSLRYMGAVQVNVAIKSLDFNQRTAITKACICLVARQIGLIDQQYMPDPNTLSKLNAVPDLKFTQKDIIFVVNTESLTIRDRLTGDILLSHNMHSVSFASGGDAETSHFMAYVAKNRDGSRFCHVIECSTDNVQDVIGTVGQAFDLRFRQFQQQQQRQQLQHGDAVGPAAPAAPLVPLPTHCRPTASLVAADVAAASSAPPPHPLMQSLNSAFTPVSARAAPGHEHPAGGRNVVAQADGGVQPFVAGGMYISTPPTAATNVTTAPNGLLAAGATASPMPDRETWFHGPISRIQAEELLEREGDFLVREKKEEMVGGRGSVLGGHRQFVLSGRAKGGFKHLLLVEPETGQVRTKDRIFDSISHLVAYYADHSLPILSQDGELLMLRLPVAKRL